MSKRADFYQWLYNIHVCYLFNCYNTVCCVFPSEVNVNAQNRGTLWTPLHAATFQEHGPVSRKGSGLLVVKPGIIGNNIVH